MAKTVSDLMALTGWSRHTVIAALRHGALPGYQNHPHGHWSIPDEAFARVADGTWRPPQPHVRVVRPVRRVRRAP